MPTTHMVQCVHCDKEHALPQYVWSGLCAACAATRTMCPDCEGTYVTDEYDNCPDCYEEEDDAHCPRHVRKSLNVGESHPFYMGWELEVEMKQETRNRRKAMQVAERPWTELKLDGSLDFGFEVAADPMSWDWVQANKPALTEWLGELRKQCDAYHTDTCGLHVHLDRAAFEGDHLYRFIHLFYQNRRLITQVSQRPREELDRWASLNIEEPMYNSFLERLTPKKPTLASCKAKARGHADHKKYAAINTCGGGRTIEVRVFKSTLCPQAFFKNLEFLHAAWVYSKQAASVERSGAAFKLFAFNNGNTYPNLEAFFRHPKRFKTDKELR
jgi:hypothetical protein